MKTSNKRRGLIALVPLVVIAILSIGNRIGAMPDQNQEIREAANEVGIVVQGGITHGQVLRFNVALGPGAGPHTNNHPGGMNLELNVFDSQGNVVATHLFQFPAPGQNQGNNTWRSQSFDLNADLLSTNTYDNTGRAQLTGVVRALTFNGTHPTVSPGPPTIVVSGEIFNFGDGNGGTLIHIAGVPQ